jgi:secreted PhoX family phosphatase
VLIRWGDRLLPDAPAFDAAKLSAAAQARQFGYNCDFIGYLPLPAGSDNSEHGLLVVNHEYTNAELMWSGLTDKIKIAKLTAEQAEVELAAHGASVLEVRKEGGKWKVVEASAYARRIHGGTPIRVSGPAAGHYRLKTGADATGARVLGTLNNCAGGVTPWGTVLTAEENFNGYFGGEAEKAADAMKYKRYGVSSKSWYGWSRHLARFDVGKEPNEPNRFGWMVEIDPYDPASTPVKRTALGRFKHEGAQVAINPDGRVVLYSGDDERFDYLYKFVSEGRYEPQDRAANMRLLDSGTLYVARFHDSGKLEWLPLRHGEGKLTAENGFASQADLLIDCRLAADAVGATPMDRPEDVEPNPVTGKVYLMLTNNARRKAEQVDAVNPRSPNDFGHIVEIVPPGSDGKRDHAATEAQWEILLLAGDPSKPEVKAKYGDGVSKDGWFAAPDNCAFDARGRLWIATDQGDSWKKTGIADGVWGCDLSGPGRAVTKRLFRVPLGAECCGPCFTPDGRTLFVAVQHPAADGVADEQNFDNPAHRWPDFTDGVPPRPSVVAITKADGGEIGA